jgi:kynurenine formamidase
MSCRFLKVQIFVVASTLSLAILLFATQRHDSAVLPQYRAVIDLTGPDAAIDDLSSPQNTLMTAPAKSGGVWTLDAIPAARLIAPLAVIEAKRKNFPDSESLVTMDDVADYERIHGAIPQGAVVLVDSAKGNAMPSLDGDALHFLVQARNIVGIGSASSRVVSTDENTYLANNGIYGLGNIANLSLVPRVGAVLVVAPQKIAGASEGPVRLMALVK